MLPGPNAVPADTRVVVNIPAYRMDLFKEGQLIQSYKIGIGYPQFPLPTGLRKAQSVIFNPTWTPPDEPWVGKMKDIAVGEKVPAGSPLNRLAISDSWGKITCQDWNVCLSRLCGFDQSTGQELHEGAGISQWQARY
jgi:hypothetical protein